MSFNFKQPDQQQPLQSSFLQSLPKNSFASRGRVPYKIRTIQMDRGGLGQKPSAMYTQTARERIKRNNELKRGNFQMSVNLQNIQLKKPFQTKDIKKENVKVEEVANPGKQKLPDKSTEEENVSLTQFSFSKETQKQVPVQKLQNKRKHSRVLVKSHQSLKLKDDYIPKGRFSFRSRSNSSIRNSKKTSRKSSKTRKSSKRKRVKQDKEQLVQKDTKVNVVKNTPTLVQAAMDKALNSQLQQKLPKVVTPPPAQLIKSKTGNEVQYYFKEIQFQKMKPYTEDLLKNENLNTLVLNRVQEVYDNGTKYVGEKKDENFHGFGTLTFPNGEVYEGEFKENKRNGYGKRFIKNNVLIYEGEWKEDKYQGRGILYNPKFQKDSKIDPSIFENFNKLKNYQWEKFEGEFNQGKWHGVGILTFAGGSKYNGQFYDNSIHGFGGIYKQHVVDFVGRWQKGNLQNKY